MFIVSTKIEGLLFRKIYFNILHDFMNITSGKTIIT